MIKAAVESAMRPAALRIFVLALCVLLPLNSLNARAERQEYLRPDILSPPANNTATPDRTELGKFLFFDPRLSGSNWISCATCHNPALGWADGLPTGIGHGMESLGRSSPTVLNTAYNKFQFWDGRSRSLEDQALAPIINAGEMHQDIDSLAEELSAIPGYVTMFEQAYPSEGINESTISRAIAAYERTLITPDAPFDLWVAGDDGAIDDAAKRGFQVFEGKGRCSVCHHGFNFQDDGFHNIGLKSEGVPDLGRYTVRPVAVLKGAFKTPTLRELARTAPYMHNGSYATLREVVEHYDRGGDVLEAISPEMRPLNLTEAEIADILAFLDTLNSSEPLSETFPILPQ